MAGDDRRCVCGQKLNSYNTSGVCGPCAVRETQEHIQRSMLPRSDRQPLLVGDEPTGCRRVGCPNPICERSLAAADAAHRWRRLCAEHYAEQRARQSRITSEGRALRAAAARAGQQQIAS